MIITLSKPINSTQLSFLRPGLKEQLSTKHPLYILADQIHWQLFEESFRKHYREDFGRPAKHIRLMVALIMLKHYRYPEQRSDYRSIKHFW